MKTTGNIEKFYQYAFPMPTVLVTCHDTNNKPNIVTVAWHTTLSKNPPLYALSLASTRYSFDLIKKTGEFVVNFCPYDHVQNAHICGTHSGRNTDKTKKTGFTLIPSLKVKVPSIKECYAHLECRLTQQIPTGDHILIVGEVLAVRADENVFLNDILQTDYIQPLYYLGNNIYTAIDKTKKHKL